MPIANFEAAFTDYVATTGTLTFGTDLFSGWLPESVNNATVLRFLAGRPPAGDEQRFRPTVQVLTRNVDTATARSVNGGLYDLLHAGEAAQYRITLTGFACFNIHATQVPFAVGEDEEGRAQWSFGLQMDVYPE